MAAPSDPAGPTGRLSTWVVDCKLDQVPLDITTRAKHIILDGLACAIVGAHLPWSEKTPRRFSKWNLKGIRALSVGTRYESLFGGTYQLILRVGSKQPSQKLSPVMAALLNSTSIQSFEIDDWHSTAPLHSESIVLPSLFAAVEHVGQEVSNPVFSGNDFLLSSIVGFETGPRVGLGLQGPDILSLGWHSGAIFGPPAAATAVAKLLGLSAEAVEDALGMACTQACGLMSAQFESEVKRMQHGFAARNGLFAALLARRGYVGIKRVFERSYGGFLDCFTKGNGQTPQYKLEEVAKDLGKAWQTEEIRLKPYAAMAGTHGTIDCVRGLQEGHPEKLKDLSKIKDIKIEMGENLWHHGGWKAERPILPTGAQMSNAYCAATQPVDGELFVRQFRPDRLDRDSVWDLVNKTRCVCKMDWRKFVQRMAITFEDDSQIQYTSQSPRGVTPPLSNQELVDKWRGQVKDLIDDERRQRIETLVLNLEECNDIRELIALLSPPIKKSF